MNNSSVLKEIIVNADEESLNRAVAEKNIAPRKHHFGDLPTAEGSRDRRLRGEVPSHLSSLRTLRLPRRDSDCTQLSLRRRALDAEASMVRTGRDS